MIQANKIAKILERMFPDATCALIYQNSFQLLIATILSAQTTDMQVNRVTPALFQKFPTAERLAGAELQTVAEIIRQVGFFQTKAKNIIACANQLVELHNGVVPQTMSELVILKGVGRKTANVVLGNYFNINEGFVVDTHIGRTTKRLGLTKHEDPKKVELDLMKLFPKDQWTILSHRLINLGRTFCQAKKTECRECNLNSLCKLGSKKIKSSSNA